IHEHRWRPAWRVRSTPVRPGVQGFINSRARREEALTGGSADTEHHKKMPSREVGNLAVAAAFALFSAFLFFARDEAGAWRENFLYLPIGGSTAPIAS
ncbi:unnamed protein product, partial [Ectocarpus sp. 12 AP-2014]